MRVMSTDEPFFKWRDWFQLSYRLLLGKAAPLRADATAGLKDTWSAKAGSSDARNKPN